MQLMEASSEIRSLSEISGIQEPMLLEETIPASEKLIEFMHSGERRLSGEPYMRHPKRVKECGDNVLRETGYKVIGQAAFLCHDLGEIGAAVLDPFGEDTTKYSSSLNYFFRNIGESGSGICYVVKEMTNVPGISYLVQMRASALKIAPASDEIRRPLDILKVIGKGLDMFDNANPEEKVDEDYYKAVYREHAGGGRVHLLKDNYKLSKYFGKGEEISSAEMFISALKEKHANKLLAKAVDSIYPYVEPTKNYPYLPLVERLLLEETNEKDRELFNPDAMMDVLRKWQSNCEIIIDIYGKSKMDLIHHTGYFRGSGKQSHMK